MLRRATRLIAAALVGALAGGPAEGRHLSPLGVQELRERLVAPAFTLPTVSRGTLGLRELRGQVVFLNFWATWCPPCVAELPHFEKLQRELGAQGLVFVSVSVDTQGEKVVAPFWEQRGLSFHSLLDPSGAVATRYGVRALPTSFLIGRDGEIIARILGPRHWDSDTARAVLRNLLEGADHRESRP
jgi:peroxiredoxin